MIASLEGKITHRTDKFVIISVHGAGYRVFCSAATLKKIGQKDEQAKLFTHLYLRENLLDLYGFLTLEELEFFELLISVSGIGPKAALSVMMLASVKNLKEAIASGQKTLLTKVSGIGQRTAERIILELKSKVFASVSDIKKLSSDSEAAEALASLGYTKSQAKKALEQVPEDISGVESRVKEALKIMGKL